MARRVFKRKRNGQFASTGGARKRKSPVRRRRAARRSLTNRKNYSRKRNPVIRKRVAKRAKKRAAKKAAGKTLKQRYQKGHRGPGAIHRRRKAQWNSGRKRDKAKVLYKSGTYAGGIAHATSYVRHKRRVRKKARRR